MFFISIVIILSLIIYCVFKFYQKDRLPITPPGVRRNTSRCIHDLVTHNCSMCNGTNVPLRKCIGCIRCDDRSVDDAIICYGTGWYDPAKTPGEHLPVIWINKE